ncbi:hypothetical protein BD410DRAFT_418578 [Rickenella mellea]|uniref:Uncharacterized protein n=1 Tax=Rickenella mellea TaxID=50990 RepID=A0A4Y7QIE5_9AGAM|nr:hypothetical protein BD410DRAFT_418578 [Rickenella mellea]
MRESSLTSEIKTLSHWDSPKPRTLFHLLLHAYILHIYFLHKKGALELPCLFTHITFLRFSCSPKVLLLTRAKIEVNVPLDMHSSPHPHHLCLNPSNWTMSR